MHDSAMPLGAPGCLAYDARAGVVTPYFGVSVTGQIKGLFPVTPLDGGAIPPTVARRADGCTAIANRL